MLFGKRFFKLIIFNLIFVKDREANLEAWLSPYKNLTNKDSNEFMLIMGAQIVKEIRDDIFMKLGYKCSAGIANNKVILFK